MSGLTVLEQLDIKEDDTLHYYSYEKEEDKDLYRSSVTYAGAESGVHSFWCRSHGHATRIHGIVVQGGMASISKSKLNIEKSYIEHSWGISDLGGRTLFSKSKYLEENPVNLVLLRDMHLLLHAAEHGSLIGESAEYEFVETK